MTRLSPPDYLEHIRTESRRFRDAMADCDPAARVPGCPAWAADDLLWHLAKVQHWWGHVISTRPAPPDEYVEPERPADHAGLLAAYDEYSVALFAGLEQADPADQAWSWHYDPANHTVGWTLRRQAHEALIHRVDAEQTVGSVGEIDVRLAADGVDEVLDVMYGGCPPWATWEGLPHYVRIDLIDADESVWCQLGHLTGTDKEGVAHDEDDFHVVADPGVEPDAVIQAEAADADLRFWKRGTDERFHVAGDRAMIDRLNAWASPAI